MVAIADFVDDVLDDVGGCPPKAAIKAIRQAAIEFCRQTEAWQYDHDDIALIATLSELCFSLPDGARLRRISNMLNSEGSEVIEKDDRWLDENATNWRTVQGDGDDIKYFNQASPDVVRLIAVPKTTAVAGLTGVRMILVPLQDSTVIGDVLWEDHKDSIADGAKWRLLRQIDKPWSDKDAAREYNNSFMGSMRDARYQANKGFSGGVLSVTNTDYAKNSSRSQAWYEEED